MRILIGCIVLVLLTVAPIFGDNSDLEQSESNFESSSSSHSASSSSENGSSPKVSNSQSSVTVNRKCKNGNCQTCIGDKCFKGGNYTSIRAVAGCPVTVCVKGCDSLVVASDGCPICSCNDGTGLREPCNDNSDCPKNATSCRENACWYSNVAASSPRLGRSCTFDFNCPSGYECRQQTCHEGGPVHSEHACVFDNQCDDDMRCDTQRMTCYPQ